MKGPVTNEAIAAIEAFYTARRAAVKLDVSSHADPTLLAVLRRRGYVVEGLVHVLARAAAAVVKPGEQGGDGVRVRPARGDEAEAWSRLVAQGFTGDDAVGEAAMELGRIAFARPGVACFIAALEGRPIGAGAVALASGVASLFATSTRPDGRRRGAQSALLAERVAHAGRVNADLVTVSVDPGTASHRNVERAGFRVLYTRVTFVRDAR